MLDRRVFLAGAIAAAAAPLAPRSSHANSEQIRIAGGAGRLNLLRRGGEGPPVLLIHPYSPGTAAAFDVPGLSWMDHLARRRRDLWALDLAGFGASTRPASMEGSPNAAPPAERAIDALRDLESAISHILAVRTAASLDLIGWSFGSVAAAMYAIARADRVKSLVLLGSMHGFDLPFMAEPFEETPGALRRDLPAYRVVTPQFALAHWTLMRRSLPPETVQDDVVKQVEAILQASDPDQAPNIRQPMGPLVDLHAIWRNRPIYDAAAVKTATLVVRGDHDLFADPGLVGKLTGAPWRDEVVIKDATHWVLFERRRQDLLAAVDKFLDRST